MAYKYLFYDSYMEKIRQQWLRSIHSVEVQVGGKWYRGELNQKEIVSKNILTLTATFPELDSKECTITAYRIIDINGDVAASQNRTINKASGQGTMIKIEINIIEDPVRI